MESNVKSLCFSDRIFYSLLILKEREKEWKTNFHLPNCGYFQALLDIYMN